MTRLPFTILSVCLLLVAAGPIAAQQRTKTFSPTSLAFKLTSQLDKNSSDYKEASQEIARDQWRKGNYDAVLAQIKTLDPEDQEEEIYGLLQVVIKPGEHEPAAKLLEQALALLKSNPEASDSSRIMSFVKSAAKFDRLELASGLTELLKNGSAKKSEALFWIAVGFAMRGENDKAVMLLNRAVEQFEEFSDDDYRAIPRLTSLIARALARLDQRERALALLDRIRVMIASQPGGHHDDAGTMAVTYAEIGETAKGASLLDSNSQPGTLISLAHAYRDNGQDSLALLTIARAQQQIEQDDHYTLSYIAEAYIDVGHPNEAFEIMKTMNNSWDIRGTSIALAAAFDRSGRREDALAALDFAFGHFRLMVSEKSEDIPASASDSVAGQKSRALVAIVTKYLELGDLRRAEQAAREIDQPQYRASAFASVAAARSKNKDSANAKLLLDRAFKLSTIAEPYNHDLRRCESLFAIAEGYAESGFKREAAGVVVRFIRELQSDEYCCGAPITPLLEVGRMTEAKGIPLDRATQKALQQLEKSLAKDK